MIDLIYCGVGNRRLDKIAINCGFKYGMRLPALMGDPPFPLYFADQDWKNPNKETYLSLVKKHRPEMCTVIDWEEKSQEKEVFEWAEEAASICNTILIVPKIPGTINSIPKNINGKEIRLAYSVPTKYGKTPVPVNEFKNRKVHLLGGSPIKQLDLYDKMNVVSADGNYLAMKAIRFCQVWTNKKGYTRHWVHMEDILGEKRPDSLYMAFVLSCVNCIEAWRGKTGQKTLLKR